MDFTDIRQRMKSETVEEVKYIKQSEFINSHAIKLAKLDPSISEDGAGSAFKVLWHQKEVDLAINEDDKARRRYQALVDQTQNIYERKLFNSKQMAVRGFGNAWFNLTTSYRMPISLCKLSANFIEMFLPDTENIRPLPLQDEQSPSPVVPEP